METYVHVNLRRALLACIVPMVAAAAPARAQEPAKPDRCEAQRDSLKAGMVRDHPPLVRTLVLFYVAPSALLLSSDFCMGDDEELAFWRDHVSAYASVGGMASTKDVGLVHSIGVEVFALGAYAEVRLDRYHPSDRVEMWDARVGYLIHPSQGIAGGVTAGWRGSPDTPDGWTGGGLMIGFPIMFTACGEGNPCWLQWEPIYVISGRGLGFTPRLRLNLPLARTPLVARVDLEARGMRKADPMSVSIGLGLRP
jgi:hypothetical protein